MSGMTISAYTDVQTAERVATLARLEDRKPSQIASAALRFYTSLPPEAHRAYRQIESLGGNEATDIVHRAVTRTLLDAIHTMAEQRIVQKMPAPSIADDDVSILAESIRMTTKR